MKSFFLASLLAVSALMTSSAARADVVIKVDLNAVVCALLPADLQGDCFQDLYYGDVSPEGVTFCQNVASYDRMSCIQKFQAGFYSKNAVKACSRVSNYEKLGCLDRIRDGYFETQAVDFCTKSGGVASYDENQCMTTVKNRVYSSYELAACSTVASYEKISCLTVTGQKLDIRSGRGSVLPPPAQVPPPQVVIITQPVSTCEVTNSSSSLGFIERSKFASFAKQTAKQNGSCVVTSIYGETGSRVLYSETGKVVASGLTAKDASDLKNLFGLDRCMVLVCK